MLFKNLISKDCGWSNFVFEFIIYFLKRIVLVNWIGVTGSRD